MSPRIRATVYDGETFHEIPYGVGTGDWIRGLSTAALERLAGGSTRSGEVNPRGVQRLAQRDLEGRRPDRLSRAIETAADVRARRQWSTLMPVLTNYNGGS